MGNDGLMGMIPFEMKISADTGGTPMPPWPSRVTRFPCTSRVLILVLARGEGKKSTGAKKRGCGFKTATPF
jgi:hypothetical protein